MTSALVCLVRLSRLLWQAPGTTRVPIVAKKYVDIVKICYGMALAIGNQDFVDVLNVLQQALEAYVVASAKWAIGRFNP